MKQPTAPNRDYRYWLEVISRRRMAAIQTALLVFSLVLLVTFSWPPSYQSTAKILVQDKRAQYLVSSDLQGDSSAKQMVSARPVTQEDLNSEIELLTSTYLIKAAIAGFPLPQKHQGADAAMFDVVRLALNLPTLGYETLHDTPAMTPEDKWALKLERNLHPAVIKLSNIIEINFVARDPQWARVFLGRLVDQYLAFHAGLSSDPQAKKFFNQQAQLLQTKLESSEDEVRQFEVQSGLTDLSAQKQAAVARLSDLETQRNRNDAEVAATREQLATLSSQIDAVPERIRKEVRSVQNASLQQLKPQVMELKAERGELLSRYQPNSQRIQEIDAKLAAAEKILDAEDQLEVEEKSSDLNPIWVSLTTNEEQAKTNLATGLATQIALHNEIAQAESELRDITNNGLTLTRLERQVANDREAYLSYVRKGEEASTAQALNLSKILNVSVAQPPSQPLTPLTPKVPLNLLLGLVLAVGLGFGAVCWEEHRDDRIYNAASIYDVTGLKTVAIVQDEA